jgi:hypothetical protein
MIDRVVGNVVTQYLREKELLKEKPLGGLLASVLNLWMGINFGIKIILNSDFSF